MILNGDFGFKMYCLSNNLMGILSEEYSAMSVVALGGLVKTSVLRTVDGGLPYYSLTISQWPVMP